MTKIKEYKRFKNTKAQKTMKKIIDNHEIWSRCYYWKPPSVARMRRSKEFETSLDFIYCGKTYEIKQSLTCSARNYNYRLSIHCDGAKKDIRLLKSFFAGEY